MNCHGDWWVQESPSSLLFIWKWPAIGPLDSHLWKGCSGDAHPGEGGKGAQFCGVRCILTDVKPLKPMHKNSSRAQIALGQICPRRNYMKLLITSTCWGDFSQTVCLDSLSFLHSLESNFLLISKSFQGDTTFLQRNLEHDHGMISSGIWFDSSAVAGTGDLILDSLDASCFGSSFNCGKNGDLCLSNKDSCVEDPLDKTLNTPGRILYCHHRQSKSRGLGRGMVSTWSILSDFCL